MEETTLFEEIIELDYMCSLGIHTDHEASFLVESVTQTVSESSEREKKTFHRPRILSKNCYCYTGVTRSKLDLVFEF